MREPIYLNALGMINALGNNPMQVAQALFSADTHSMESSNDWIPGRTTLTGAVQHPLPEIDSHLSYFSSRNNQLLLAAIRQIESEIRTIIHRYGSHRVGIVLGTSTSGISETELALSHKHHHGHLPQSYAYAQHEFGSPAAFLSAWLGLDAPAYTISTACTSSAKAFQSARNLIKHGICDAVLVGGVDSLCKLTLGGFHALESIASSRCNPMSKNRAGINIGEGAAVFIMSKEQSPNALELLGIGESNDAYHISSPHPEGKGAIEAMLRALKDADIDTKYIQYLNLHATATEKNDAMESLAVSHVFPDGVLCSGTKPLTGHTLGAAGATELAFCALSIQHDQLPMHRWDGEFDTSLPKLNLVTQPCAFVKNKPRICMSNSFAFGGSNVSMIIGESHHGNA